MPTGDNNWIPMLLYASVFIHLIINGWYNKQMDSILAYPHAPAEVPLCLHFSQGYIFKRSNEGESHSQTY